MTDSRPSNLLFHHKSTKFNFSFVVVHSDDGSRSSVDSMYERDCILEFDSVVKGNRGSAGYFLATINPSGYLISIALLEILNNIQQSNETRKANQLRSLVRATSKHDVSLIGTDN
ncbi:hypothetical protein Tco_1119114 [Tanacetum coccineum]